MFKCSCCGYSEGEMGRVHLNIGPFHRLKLENAAICDWCVKGTKEYKELEALVQEMTPFVRGGWCKEGDTVWPDAEKSEEILSRLEKNS